MPIYSNGSSGGNATLSQLDNKLTRLNAVGVNPTNALDTRNWIEKALNLPKDQNAFLDIMEILGRPQQGLLAAIDDNISGRSLDPGTSFLKGLKGERTTDSFDLAKKISPNASDLEKNLLGLGILFGADPVNLVPGAVLGKGLKAPINLAGSLGRGAINIADKLAPSFKVGERTDDFLNNLGHVFNNDHGKTPFLKGKETEYNNLLSYMRDENFDEVVNLAKNHPDTNFGRQVMREMERNLQINKSPEEFLQGLIKNGPNQTYKTNLFSGDLRAKTNLFNQGLRNLPEIQSKLKKLDAQSRAIDAEIQAIIAKHGTPKELNRIISTHLNPKKVEQAEKALDRFNKMVAKKQSLKSDIAGLRMPIQFEKMATGGKGFKSKVSRPGTLRSAIKGVGGLDEFIKSVSPTKKFDDMVDATKRVDVRDVASDLLRSGRVLIPNSSAKTNVVGDIERVFGKDVRVTRNSHNIGITLQKGSSYHGQLLDDIDFIDKINNVNIPRPSRPKAKDPEAVNIAQALSQLPEEIRMLAASKGLPMNELDSYMTHVLSEEEKLARGMTSDYDLGKDTGRSTQGGSNKPFRSREYEGSVEDINEREGKTLFQEDPFIATLVGYKRQAESVISQSLLNDILKSGDPSLARPRKGKYDLPGKDEVVIQPDQLKFFQVAGSDFSRQMGIAPGQEWIVSKAAKRVLDNFEDRVTDQSMKNAIGAYDKILDLWKGITLATPAYHVRNDFGASFNMWIGGMSWASITKYKTKAFQEIVIERGKNAKHYDDFKKQGLKQSTFLQSEFRYSGVESEQAIRDAIAYERLDTVGKAKEKLKSPLQSNMEIGQLADEMNRYAMFEWALDKGKTPEQAAELVKKVQFDYSDLTQAERKVFRRIFPFYTFMKKNAVFMATSFLADPKKFYNADKAVQATYEMSGIDEEVLPSWLRESTAIGAGEDKLVNLNLPMASLSQMTDPLKMLTDALTPAAKLPLEYQSNFDHFMEKPIREFEGQTEPFLGMNIDPKNAHVLRQFGAIRALDSLFQNPSVQTGTFGIVRNYDQQKEIQNKQYQLLRDLDGLMKKYEQDTGQKVPTLREMGR